MYGDVRIAKLGFLGKIAKRICQKGLTEHVEDKIITPRFRCLRQRRALQRKSIGIDAALSKI